MSSRPSSAPPEKPGKGTASNLFLDARARIAEVRKLRKSGQLARAIAVCEALVKDHPTFLAALQLLGQMQMEKQNYWVSLTLYIQAAMLNPRDAGILAGMSNVFLRLGANKLAAQTMRQAPAEDLEGKDPNVHLTLGQIYRKEQEFDLAATSYTRALELDASQVWAAYGLGLSHYAQGRMKEAATALQRAQQLKPGIPHVLYTLGQLPASVVDINLLGAVDLARQINTSRNDEVLRCLGLARAAALNALGRHKEAWDELVQANLRQDLQFAADWEGNVRKLRQSRRQAENLAALDKKQIPISDEAPMSLFILGPSRCGKTSLERLIGTVEGVKCGYESQVLRRAIQQAFQKSELPIMERLSDLPRRFQKKFSGIYAADLRDRAGKAVAFTSTNPGSVHDVGAAALLVPNCKFIFVKRDRYDTAFRMFGKNYEKNRNRYASNLGRSLHYIDWYYELVGIWSKMLPDRTLIVDYEDMVADPAATLARVTKFCGLAMPAEPVPQPGDDRGCSAPYRALIDAAALHSGA